MKLYSENKNYKLYHGSMLDMLEVIEQNSIDSIVTDPPYGLTSITKRFGKEGAAPAQYGKDGAFSRLSKGFMGKEWDGSGIEYNVETWQRCYEVLKPGGYLLAFGGSRTYHRIACAIEDAGFEIRDCIMWLYGSGFPKSMNIGKEYDKKMGNKRDVIGTTRIGKTSLGDNSGWDTSENMKKVKESGQVEITKGTSKWEGYGTCLKPAYEPIIIARKPFKGSLVNNVIENGVGGLNIDECRVDLKGEKQPTGSGNPAKNTTLSSMYSKGNGKNGLPNITSEQGRFPANVIHDGLEEEWSRYFYCAKASKKDRDEGLDEFEIKQCVGGGGGIGDYLKDVNSCSGKFGSEKAPHKNTHPTVKPTSLMQYLIRLVTPKNGTILDPFMGSGSTGKAAMYENKERNANYKFIGIELTEEYLPIANARIEYIANLKNKEEKENNEIESQMNIFDLIEEVKDEAAKI